jgi:hypothetical protein
MLRQPPPPLISSAARFHAASRVLLQSPSTQSPFLQLLFPGVGSLAILPTSILNSVPTLAGSRRAIQLLPHSQPSCLTGRLAATPPPRGSQPPGVHQLPSSAKTSHSPAKTGRLAVGSAPAILSASRPKPRLGDSCSGGPATPPPAAQACCSPDEPAPLLPIRSSSSPPLPPPWPPVLPS